MAMPKKAVNDQPSSLYARAGGMSRRTHFEAGERIFEIGDERTSAYIIESGEVHILDDKGEVLCVLKSGEIFGEMALVAGGERSAAALVAEKSEIFVVPRGVIEQRMENLDPVINLLIALLIERYRVTRIHMPESIREEGAEELVERLAQSRAGMQMHKETAMRELQMEQELRRALLKKEFEPFLQPIVDLPSRQIMGFEALIRWNHPERGIVGPYEFVPVAERTGVVQLLDTLMLEKVCSVLPDFIKKAGRDVFIGVNISGINFGTIDLVEIVGQLIKETKIKPETLHLEITESALIDDPARAEDVLRGLKDLGVRIALDDFGTGYSSLSYLHKFSIDILKIDRAFIDRIDQNTKSQDIVRAIMALAKNFNLETVAEGIEREEEVVAVNSLNCDRAQGYLFSKPVSLDDAKALL